MHHSMRWIGVPLVAIGIYWCATHPMDIRTIQTRSDLSEVRSVSRNTHEQIPSRIDALSNLMPRNPERYDPTSDTNSDPRVLEVVTRFGQWAINDTDDSTDTAQQYEEALAGEIKTLLTDFQNIQKRYMEGGLTDEDLQNRVRTLTEQFTAKKDEMSAMRLDQSHGYDLHDRLKQ